MESPPRSPKWKAQYEYQLALLKMLLENKERLRFDKGWVNASEVGSQLYCERKVDFGYIHGTIKTEEMIAGTEGHETIVEDYVKVGFEEIWKDIYLKPRFLLGECMFIAQYKDILLVGKPDQIFFINGDPRLVLEFKFSNYIRPFPSQIIQAQTYSFILHNIGFNTSSLYYAIIICSPDMIQKKKELKKIAKKVVNSFWRENIEDQEAFYYSFYNTNAYLFKFNAGKTAEKLDDVLKYWRCEREAIETDNENKCKSCEFIKVCDIKHEKVE